MPGIHRFSVYALLRTNSDAPTFGDYLLAKLDIQIEILCGPCTRDEHCNDGGSVAECTTSYCQDGICTTTEPVACNDNNPCTTEAACDPIEGSCTFTPLPVGTEVAPGEICECFTAADCGPHADSCKEYACLPKPSTAFPGSLINKCVEQWKTTAECQACNSNGFCDATEDCTCGDCATDVGKACQCTNSQELDLVFAVDTSMSFNYEWRVLRERFDTIVNTFVGYGYDVKTGVYAMVNPTQCNQTRCNGGGHSSLWQSGGLSFIHGFNGGFANALKCFPGANCPFVEASFPDGKSQVAQEAYGIGGRWVIDNHEWRPNARKTLFILTDQKPYGNQRITDSDLEKRLADQLRDAAAVERITLLGLHGGWEYTTRDQYTPYGDNSELDFEELLKLTVGSTNFAAYGGGETSLINTIITMLSAATQTCGVSCRKGAWTCDPVNGVSECIIPPESGCVVGECCSDNRLCLPDQCGAVLCDADADCEQAPVPLVCDPVTDLCTACGNGIEETALGEQCDDGNFINTDNCTNACQIAICGDNIRRPVEQCDDGNQISGDGCSDI